LNPQEVLEKKETEQAVNKAKEILEPIDREIVEIQDYLLQLLKDIISFCLLSFHLILLI